MGYWSRDQQKHQMNRMKAQVWTRREVIPHDPHIGKRVFCLSLLPEQEIYGTIEQGLCCSNEQFQDIVCWDVRTDEGTPLEEPREHFALYEHPTEFKAGDLVHSSLDEGGYWEGVVLRAVLTPSGILHFVLRFQPPQDHGAVSLSQEMTTSRHPNCLRLAKQTPSA